MRKYEIGAVSIFGTLLARLSDRVLTNTAREQSWVNLADSVRSFGKKCKCGNWLRKHQCIPFGPSRPKGKNGGNFKLVDGRPSEPGIPTAILSNLSLKKVGSMAASRFLIFRAISPHFMRHSCAEYAKERERPLLKQSKQQNSICCPQQV